MSRFFIDILGPNNCLKIILIKSTKILTVVIIEGKKHRDKVIFFNPNILFFLHT